MAGCIFCLEERKLSKEHLWSDWMGVHLKDFSKKEQNVSEYWRGAGKGKLQLITKNSREGAVFTKKFRVVCQKCNNGWMSHLDDRVKSFLEKILIGKDVTLSQKNIKILCNWIVMKVMVSEHNKEDFVTLSQDREKFKNKSLIPFGYRVYLAKHDLDINGFYVRQCYTVSKSVKKPESDIKESEKNTQSVSIAIGKLLVHVIYSREPGLKIWKKIKLSSLTNIYPLKKRSINTKRLKVLSSYELEKVIFSLENLLNSKNVIHAGEL